MSSIVDIWNIALGRIGVDKTVASLTENSKEARTCVRFYEQCRDEVLEAGAWPFAVKTQALALTASQTGILAGWAYQYTRPSDALRMLDVTDLTSVNASVGYYVGSVAGAWAPDMLPRGAFSYRQGLSADTNSAVILSNTAAAYGVYVSKVTNPDAFPALFKSCLADRLAMELAMPMTSDPNWFKIALTRYNQSFMLASTAAYEQVQDGPGYDPPGIRARS